MGYSAPLWETAEAFVADSSAHLSPPGVARRIASPRAAVGERLPDAREGASVRHGACPRRSASARTSSRRTRARESGASRVRESSPRWIRRTTVLRLTPRSAAASICVGAEAEPLGARWYSWEQAGAPVRPRPPGSDGSSETAPMQEKRNTCSVVIPADGRACRELEPSCPARKHAQRAGTSSRSPHRCETPGEPAVKLGLAGARGEATVRRPCKRGNSCDRSSVRPDPLVAVLPLEQVGQF